MASGVFKTKILSSSPRGLCHRLKLILQEKQGGKKSNIVNDEIVAIVDELLEYKCMPEDDHQQIFLNVIYYTKEYICSYNSM